MNNGKQSRKLNPQFSYKANAAVPEIPYAQDVLYVLRRSEVQKCYSFCLANHKTYTDNVQLVVEKVGYRITSMKSYDEAKARKIIAEAIIDLCPVSARCFFNQAFVEAKEVFTGIPLPLKGVASETIRRACHCPSCAASFENEMPFTD